MRKLKKFTAVALAVALVLTSMGAVFTDGLQEAFAADSAAVVNIDKANTLQDLGLYKGQDADDPLAGLDAPLTTEDSLVFLSRQFGYEDAANDLTSSVANAALEKFEDAESIADYAKNIVAYSASNSILNGISREGELFVGAKDTVTAARFATFMLKQMGYTVSDYKESIAKLAEVNGSNVRSTVSGDLTRSDAVGIMYDALLAEQASGVTVIEDLVGSDPDLRKIAVESGLLSEASREDDDSDDSGDDSVPFVSRCTVYQNDSITIVFNIALDEETAQAKTSYALTNVSANAEVPAPAIEYDAAMRTVTLYFDSPLEENTSYKLSIVHCKDLHGNEITTPYEYSFTTGDYKAPEVIYNPFSMESSSSYPADGIISILYSEAMNEDQMLDKENYAFATTGSAIVFTPLGANDTVTKIDARRVELYIKALDVQNDATLPISVKIAPIMDLAGKKLTGSNGDDYIVELFGFFDK